MAFELSSNETFFNGLLNDTNFEIAGNEASTPGKRKDKPGRKSGGKSKLPATAPKGKPPRRGKENATPRKVSGKTGKEPLAEIVASGEKSPRRKGGEERPPTKRRSRRDSLPALQGAKAPEKKNGVVPKIVVYEDPESGGGEEKRVKGSKRRVSRTWEGRKSLPEGRKSPKNAGGVRRACHSFNDLTSLKSPKKEKSSKEEKARPRKLNPSDPEFGEMVMKLEILFPGVDPEFLRSQFVKLKGSLAKTIEFVLLQEKTNELPTRADYLRRAETEKLQRKFMESFTVESFLEMIPDPWDYFLHSERHNCIRYSGQSLHYLKNKFKKHYLQAIQDALVKNDYSLYLANKELSRKNRLLKMRLTNRSKSECDLGKPLTFDVQFVQEVAFIENEMKIKAHLKKERAAQQKRFEKAQREGTLLECQSCNELALLEDEAVRCPANHVFCKDCVVKYLKNSEIEKDSFQFKCLVKCEEKFPVESLRAVLSPTALERIAKRNQVEETTKPGEVKDLVCCPFCYSVIVLPPELSLLKCLNPSCLKESCRHCKQLNHIPLKCYELENFNNTLLLEAGTESSLRCIRCNEEFVKREDSNKMACPCGATVCSVCRQPFPECPHFNGPGIEPSPERLSSTSEDTEYTEADDNPSRRESRPQPPRHPPSPTDSLRYLPSSSDSF